MHVLVLPSWYSTVEVPWKGVFFESQARALARAGARVGVVFVEQRSLRVLSASRVRESHFQTVSSSEDGVMTLRMNGWNTLGQTVIGARIWAALSQRLVRAYVNRFGVPDVLHAHAALWAGRVALRTARLLGRPCVVTEHSSQVLLGLRRGEPLRETARVYREADAVLAVSRKLLSAVCAVAAPRITRVVPNAIDFDFFTLPPSLRRRDPFTYLSVSNLVSGKRLDALIRAFASIARADRGLRLVIVGEGSEGAALRRLAHDCDVGSQVQFAGALPPDGVRRQMWSANALVLPSAFETFGVVLVEALATGMPVISTRCGGPEEIVDPEVGLLVEPDDQEALTTAMLTLARRSYSEHALRARAQGHFGFEAVARQLFDVYATVQAVRAASSAHPRPAERRFR